MTAERIWYFAYGSNMAIQRLRARVPSADFGGIATLTHHDLRFHKRSKRDGSGKCDAAYTGDAADTVFGALYSVSTADLEILDRFDGRGQGYERKAITVVRCDGVTVEAHTYTATDIDGALRPFDWYKEHVLRGARDVGLSADYIAKIEAIAAEADRDEERRRSELAIYSGR